MTIAKDPLLNTTRVVLFIILGIVGFVGIALALASAAIPLWWDDALAAIAREKPTVSPAGLQPMMLVLFAGIIVILGLVWTVVRKLIAIVGTVSEGDPFVRANAIRLRAIGWLLIAIELGGIPVALLASRVADRFGDNDVNYEISVSGLLAILMTFVLARVFQRGAEMREELEGTV